MRSQNLPPLRSLQKRYFLFCNPHPSYPLGISQQRARRLEHPGSDDQVTAQFGCPHTPVTRQDTHVSDPSQLTAGALLSSALPSCDRRKMWKSPGCGFRQDAMLGRKLYRLAKVLKQMQELQMRAWVSGPVALPVSPGGRGREKGAGSREQTVH